MLPAVQRLVAIGDLHGDLKKARRAFRLGGLTDENDRWIGGTTTAVQVQTSLRKQTTASGVLSGQPGSMLHPRKQHLQCAAQPHGHMAGGPLGLPCYHMQHI